MASFKCQLSNSPVEGINNKIKVIKRVSYGYRNFDHFRGRILLSCRNEYIDFDHLNTQKIA
ncbi:transposase [Ligilactobacillus hohenheimensis]|uniref:transposase n=1 Tax=Ligilactobacillus hohenheimensis TaxID=2991832 RepID=UPI00398D1460